MQYYQPVPSSSSRHKFDVRVWDPFRKRDVIVSFGAPAYQDYTQHSDNKRRENYLRRSAGIRNGAGDLTKDDPLSANYWSRRFLWASGEPWYVYLPPTLTRDDFAPDVVFLE